MLYFVEGLPIEWQQTWDHMRLKSGRYDWTSKLIFNAMLVIFYAQENLTAEFVSECPPPVETRAKI
jgi:hypothetical protein